MISGDIDWGAQLQAQKLNSEWTPEVVESFIGRAATDLEQFYISPEIMDTVATAGCDIKGVRYFADLYSKDETVTPEARLWSTIIGSVAHGQSELAGEAYSLLMIQYGATEVDAYLLGQINASLRRERAHMAGSGSPQRTKNLEAAAEILAKPLFSRHIGSAALGQTAEASSF